jgi:hypothetical protein
MEGFNSVVTMDILGEIILNCRNYIHMKVDNHDDVIRSVLHGMVILEEFILFYIPINFCC